MSTVVDPTHVDPDSAHEPEVVRLPDTPRSVTLTFEDGKSVSIDVNNGDRERPVYGVFWGDAVETMSRLRRVRVEWREPTDERERVGWIARTHTSPAATTCRWEDGCLICS